MKKFKFNIFILIILIIPCCFILGGCLDKKIYVTNIALTKSFGDVNQYTVLYSDGSTSTFDVTVNTTEKPQLVDVFNQLVALGYYEDNDEDFDSFLTKYLSINQTESIKEVASKSLQSAVAIYCKSNEISNDLSCGAGVIYKMEETYSYIITNQHVVYNTRNLNSISSKITVAQYGKNYLPVEGVYYDGVDCEYVGGSISNDVAVLRVNTADLKANNPTAKAVDIGSGYSVAENVFAIGNPEGHGISVSRGIVSVVNEYISMDGVDGIEIVLRVLRTDCSINPGNSGGGLFNDKGELIGLINARMEGSDISNIGYALPISNVSALVDNIIDNNIVGNLILGNKKANSFKLGITTDYYSENSQTYFDSTKNETPIYDDCIIDEIAPNSFAFSIGLEVGDVICSIIINDTEHQILSSYQLGEKLYTVRANDKISVKVNRNVDGTITSLTLPETGKTALAQYFSVVR